MPEQWSGKAYRCSGALVAFDDPKRVQKKMSPRALALVMLGLFSRG